VSAVYKDRIFICECKTTKVTPNQIETKLSQLNRLVNYMKEEVNLKVVYWIISIEKNR